MRKLSVGLAVPHDLCQVRAKYLTSVSWHHRISSVRSDGGKVPPLT